MWLIDSQTYKMRLEKTVDHCVKMARQHVSFHKRAIAPMYFSGFIKKMVMTITILLHNLKNTYFTFIFLIKCHLFVLNHFLFFPTNPFQA